MSNFLTANYHAHTFRCQHAVGNERDYIEAAIKMGIKEFGFSDHIPCPFRDGYISHIRMTMDEAPEYVKTIRALADEGRTMLLVTHEMNFARQVSNKVVFLHQGLVEEQGTPEQVFDHPQSERC